MKNFFIKKYENEASKIYRSKEPYILHEELVKEIDLLKIFIENNDLENLENLKKL